MKDIDIKYLQEIGVFPFILNDSSSFLRIKDEIDVFAKQALQKELLFTFIKDDSINACAIKMKDKYFIGITDTLYQEISFDISKIINSPECEAYFNGVLNYEYTTSMFEPSETSIRQRLIPSCEKNAKLELISDCGDLLGIFIANHEIAHIHLGHLDLLSTGEMLFEFPSKTSGIINPNKLKEHQADAFAAIWLGQRIAMLREDHSLEQTRLFFSQACLAISTLQLAMPKYIDDSMTHPDSEKRLRNIFYWFWISFEFQINKVKKDDEKVALDSFFYELMQVVDLVNIVGNKHGNLFVESFTIEDFTEGSIQTENNHHQFLTLRM